MIICEACGRGHVITGRILVDGAPLRATFVEVLVEIACRHGILGQPEPKRDEPDVMMTP